MINQTELERLKAEMDAAWDAVSYEARDAAARAAFAAALDAARAAREAAWEAEGEK